MQFYNDYSPTEKKLFRYGMTVLAIGTIFAVFAAAGSYAVSAKQQLYARTDASTVAVTGEGKVAAKPDIAVLNASILTEKPTVSAAQSANTSSSNAVTAFLKKTGVDEKDVKTVNYSIYPQYFYSQYSKPEITGYQVRHTLEIKIRDLSKVDDILGGVVENGANEIGNVAFTIEKPEKLKEEARKLAIQMAKEKAQVLSEDLGVRLKHIVEFTENDFGGIPPMYYANEAFGKGGGGGGPDLSQGEQEVKVSVTIKYEFRAR
jgi:uncharacterized protein YggE